MCGGGGRGPLGPAPPVLPRRPWPMNDNSFRKQTILRTAGWPHPHGFRNSHPSTLLRHSLAGVGFLFLFGRGLVAKLLLPATTCPFFAAVPWFVFIGLASSDFRFPNLGYIGLEVGLQTGEVQ